MSQTYRTVTRKPNHRAARPSRAWAPVLGLAAGMAALCVSAGPARAADEHGGPGQPGLSRDTQADVAVHPGADAEAALRAAGACCLPDGSCGEFSQTECTAAGGTYDANADCASLGSCEFAGDCLVTSEACCDAVAGTWNSNGTCDPSTCLPSLLAPASWASERTTSDPPGSEDAGLRQTQAVTTYIDASFVLHIDGTPLAESVRLVLDGGDPNLLHIYCPEDGTGQDIWFLMTDFVSISVQLGDGDDLLVFDDAFGEIGALKPFSIDAADGQDTILTRTGGLPLNQVLTLVNQIDTLRNLMQQADIIRGLAGAVPSFPGTGSAMSNAFDMLARIEQDFITPAGQYVQDVKAQLIDPATQAVVDAHDQIIAVGLPLIKQAYEDLALAGQALQNDAEVNVRDPALNLLDVAQNQLVPHSGDVSACGGTLSGADVTAFQTNLIGLVNQLVAIVDSCPDEPAEPPEAPSPCPQVQELIDCIEKEIEDFELLADICEDDGDALELEGDSLEADGDNLELYADGYELNLENYEALADNFVLTAESFEASAEALVAGFEADLGTAGAALDAQAQVEFVQKGDTYDFDMDNQVRNLADQIQQQADQIVLDADAVIQAAAALLGASAAAPRAGTCAGISTTNTINGGLGPNILLGTSGNDLIHGHGGNDLIIGGPGDDKLYGDNASDLILGNGGTNEIHGGDGIDILIGGTDADCIYGEEEIDLIIGRAGNDDLDGGENVDIIIGWDGDDNAWGRGGIDIILGNKGNDHLDGGHCSDLLIGGPGADELIGGPGQVVTVGSVSLDLGDLLFGGDGVDTIYGDQLSKTGTGVDVAFGGAGADQIFLADGGDLVINSFTLKLGNVAFGGPDNDNIESLKGIDVLFGGPEDDAMSADEGYNVTFPSSNFEMAFGDLLFGGPGNDTLEGDDAGTNAVQDIDLLFGYTGNDTLNGHDGGLVIFSTSFQMDFGNLLFGGDGLDVLTSSNGIDLAFGGPDNDSIRCGFGSTLTYNTTLYIEFGDLIFGQGGADVLNANYPDQPTSNVADGVDLMFGGPGDDRLYGDGGGLVSIGSTSGFYFGNLMFGESGLDIIHGGYQNADTNNLPLGIDLIFGAGDDDTIDGADGSYIVVVTGGGVFTVDFGDLVFGGPENDTIDTANGLDFIFGGRGADTANTRGGIDLVFGNKGPDDLTVGDGGAIIFPPAVPITFGNLVFGGDDNDTITSEGQVVPPEIDLLFGNKCDDVIYAGGGLLDLVFGGPGYDELYGEAEIDLLFGGRHDDVIWCGSGVVDIAFGGRDADEIHGESDIDVLFGGKEPDVIFGEADIDIAFGGRGGDIIHGGNGLDVLFGNLGGDDVYGDDQLDLVFGNRGTDYVHGGLGVDLVFGGKDNDYVFGDDGLDLLFGGQEHDLLYGGADLDLLFGGLGNDRLAGDGGADLAFGGKNEDVILPEGSTGLGFGGQGQDVLLGGGVWDLYFGGPDQDWLYGSGGFDLLFGGQEPDHLAGEGDTDFLFGGQDNDDVLGGAGKDYIFGNRHNDCVDTGSGADYAFGNLHNDNVRSGNESDKDYLFGGFGADTLWGCNNLDKLWGGPGSDTKDQNNCGGCSFAAPSCGEIRGVVRVDAGSGPVPAGGFIVYIDSNQNGAYNGGEPSVVTASDDPDTFFDDAGTYRFAGLSAAPTLYQVRVIVPPGYTVTSPGSGFYAITLGVCEVRTADWILWDSCPPSGNPNDPCPSCDCPINYHAEPIWQTTSTCTYDDAPCTTDADCFCGGTCVQSSTVIDCVCVRDFDCTLASDMDEFRANTMPVDQIQMWGEFEAWVNRPNGSNQMFHGGQSLPFDVLNEKDWEFGYSFLTLPSVSGAQLSIHLQGSTAFLSTPQTDGLGLQFYFTPNPAFRWSAALNFLDAASGGDGFWAAGDDQVFVLDLAALPLQAGGTFNLLPYLNADHRLDVYVQDDTMVDYIELCYQPSDARPAGPDAVDMTAADQPAPRASELDLHAVIVDTSTAAATELVERSAPPDPPTLPAPPHHLPKMRYISFALPLPGPELTAIEVIVLPCRRLWVGPPQLLGLGTTDQSWVSELIDEPYYASWYVDTGVLHARGCVIAPEHTYEVRRVDWAGQRSTPLTLSTNPIWGDVDLDGMVDFNDLKVVNDRATYGATTPHMTFVDLAGLWPDFACDGSDVAAQQDALLGNPYPPASFGMADIAECPPRRPCQPPCADLNFDGAVDLADWALLTACVRGPNLPVSGDCAAVDIDADADVDVIEMSGFMQEFSAPALAPAGR